MEIPTAIKEVYRDPEKILNHSRDIGIKVIGYTCSYVPEELIIAAGMQPYRMSDVGAKASALTPSFVCPFASSVLENMLRLEDFFNGFVVTHSCDPMWRLYDILKAKTSKPVFFIRVPHNTGNQLSLDFFRTELLRFKRFLEENSGQKINHDKLLESIELCNESRNLLKDIYMLNRDGKSKVSGFDRFQLALASMWMPKRKFNEHIKRMNIHNNEIGKKVRLHVNGTAIYNLDLIRAVEESGGLVVSDDLCTGSRYFWSDVEKSEDPVSALAYRYLGRTPCPSNDPLESRLEFIQSMVREFDAQGLITFVNRFCDPILFDAVHIRNTLAKNGVATTVVDYENASQEIMRIKTRVESFIESIGG